MTNEPEIRYLGDLQRLSLLPTDALVLTVPGRISGEVAELMRKQLSEKFGGRTVLVLSEGMTLGAIDLSKVAA